MVDYKIGMGKRLRKQRKLLHLTQEQLAESHGVNDSGAVGGSGSGGVLCVVNGVDGVVPGFFLFHVLEVILCSCQ